MSTVAPTSDAAKTNTTLQTDTAVQPGTVVQTGAAVRSGAAVQTGTTVQTGAAVQIGSAAKSSGIVTSAAPPWGSATVVAAPGDVAIDVGDAIANPWRPIGPCTPASCVQAAAAETGPVHRAVRLFAALLVVLAGLPLALASRAVPTGRRADLTRAWARLLLRTLGIGIHVTEATTPPNERPPALPGEEPSSTMAPAAGVAGEEALPAQAPAAGALVVANHVSWLDPLVIAAAMPSRPLAKREITEWPLIRTLAAASGALFIDRERLYALPATVAAIAAALRAGDTVVAFPEGTTWCGRGMGQFRPAVFQAAVDAGAPVRPATLRYREGAAPSTRSCFVGGDTLLASLRRVAATRDLVVEVRLFAPVYPEPTTRRPEARTTLARIAEAHVRTGVPTGHGPTG
ncbi:lysophospholipid acyltransferase family protein [Nonomuraea sp. NPDC046802]|uniref:lysophospholipid acyltransferase family protein n=1 Tax=Nonomuraea sp. NPDC046802 TaxID=3154919 RepID=UPI00340700D3